MMHMGLERSQCLYIGDRVGYMGVKRGLLGEELVHYVKRVYITKYALRHLNDVQMVCESPPPCK